MMKLKRYGIFRHDSMVWVDFTCNTIQRAIGYCKHHHIFNYGIYLTDQTCCIVDVIYIGREGYVK
jgi:hypothetical protein